MTYAVKGAGWKARLRCFLFGHDPVRIAGTIRVYCRRCTPTIEERDW